MSGIHPLISVAELKADIRSPDLRVIDCRFDLLNPSAGRNAWIEAHIPGAVFADLNQDLAGPVTLTSGRHPLPDAELAAERVSCWGIDRDTRVIVYDAGGGAIAARAWWMLRWLGHERVSLLDGGFNAWLQLGGEVEQGAVTHRRRHFIAHPHDEQVITTTELEPIVRNREAICLVDARDSDRFRGEVEPIDAVAGHVPGAVNLPFADNLRPDGHWKTRDELRHVFDAGLGDRTDGPWTVMCGSGVTACHHAVAAAIIGLKAPRLYAGSWSEWISDPARPVAGGD